MLERIKKWLFKPKHLITLSTIDKIKYISEHKINYRELYTVQCYFAYDNITKYNSALKNILEQDLTGNQIELPDLDYCSSDELKFLYWCNKDNILDPLLDKHIMGFLQLSQRMIEYYNIYKSAVLKMKYYYYNLRILETHIIYLDGIIDKIYNTIKLESAG